MGDDEETPVETPESSQAESDESDSQSQLPEVSQDDEDWSDLRKGLG